MTTIQLTDGEAQLIYESLFFRELKLMESVNDLRNQNMSESALPLEDKASCIQQLRLKMKIQSKRKNDFPTVKFFC